MKPLSDLSLEKLEDIKLLSFDADGVMVERGTEVLEKDGVLTVKTKQITPELLEKVQKLKKYFRINFSSGRNLLYLNKMFGSVLWEKASLQGENGLFTLIDGQVLQTDKITPLELEKIERIRDEIQSLAKTDDNILGFEPKQFMVSVHCKKESEIIHDIVRRIDINNEFYSYWISNEAHDIFLKRFNKGVGLEFLTKYLNLDLSQTLAVGNDFNDVPILEKVEVSITTDKDTVQANYFTEKSMHLGGEEVVDKLLELVS